MSTRFQDTFGLEWIKTKENTGNVKLLTCAQSAFMTTVFKPMKDSLKSRIYTINFIFRRGWVNN